jgi:DNA-binding NarL/FixJ family response regulator
VGDPTLEQRGSVLVADDHVPMRAAIRALLERGGLFVCAEVGDAAAAIDAAAHHHPDVCLIDIGMPGNGIAATAAITATVPATRVVMLTVSRDDSDLFRALQAGAVGYLVKDDGVRDLARALRLVIDGEALISGALLTRVLREFRLRRRPLLGGPARDRRLTRREWDVLECLAEDMTTTEIAEHLGIEEATVRTHVSTMLKKYRVATRQAAVRMYRDLESRR